MIESNKVAISGELTPSVIEKIIWTAIELDAADIHVVCGEPVYVAVGGKKIPITTDTLTKASVEAFALHLAGNRSAIIDQTNDAKGVQLAYSAVNAENKLIVRRFRVSILSARSLTAGRVKTITARLLPETPLRASEMGVPSEVVNLFLSTKQGIILFVGGTGQGKSMLMSSLLTEILMTAGQNKKIQTYEDPVEVMFDNVRKAPGNICIQHEVGPAEYDCDILSYNEALRVALRSAPDVLVLGEMRDREAMKAGVAFSNTGHLLVSTMHANDCAGAFARIYNQFPEDERQAAVFDIASEAKAFISQRLVPAANGAGRIPVREILIMTAELAEKLLRCSDTNQIRLCVMSHLNEQGATFWHHAKQLFNEGMISMNEFSKFNSARLDLAHG